METNDTIRRGRNAPPFPKFLPTETRRWSEIEVKAVIRETKKKKQEGIHQATYPLREKLKKMK